MALKSDAKFEKKMTLDSKIDMRNLVNFHPTTQKSKNFTSMGYFYPKYMRFELMKYRGFVFHDIERWCKICINPNHVVSKITWGIGELSLEHSKSERLFIDGLFLSKAYNVSARKFQRNCVSWHWRVMQNLKENWLVAWKMT